MYSYSANTSKKKLKTVTTSGFYNIVAAGGQEGGASKNERNGSNGAEKGGTFNLTAGEELRIIVGDAGGGGSYSGRGSLQAPRPCQAVA